MERHFLLYVLYTAFIDIRVHSTYNKKKSREIIYKLSNLLHNIPLQLSNENDDAETYKKFCENAEAWGFKDRLYDWKEGFYHMYPEYALKDN